MNDVRFDGVVRHLGGAPTRRRMLGILAGAVGLGALALGEPAEAVVKVGAEGKGKRKGKRGGARRAGASAQAKTKPGNHCLVPGTDADLNDIYGVTAQIVTGFCPEVRSGQRWVSPGAPWSMNDSFAAVPEAFEPAEGATKPLEDFLAKFVQVRFVIDPGTRQEKTVIFPNDGNLFTGIGSQFPDTPANWDVVSPITLGTLKPLSVGDHLVELYWTLSALHCDGLAANIDENCLPAGEFLYSRRPFTVVPGHN
jgi:hypothetical protein